MQLYCEVIADSCLIFIQGSQSARHNQVRRRARYAEWFQSLRSFQGVPGSLVFLGEDRRIPPFFFTSTGAKLQLLR